MKRAFRAALLVALMAMPCLSPADEPLGHSLLLVGFNGPPTASAELHRDADAVRASWLGATLTDDELGATLGQIDFGSEALVVVAVGDRANATGTVNVAHVDRSFGGVVPLLEVGVNGPECDQPKHPAFPFVVLKISKPSDDSATVGYYVQNFDDGCKPPVLDMQYPTASPVPPRRRT